MARLAPRQVPDEVGLVDVQDLHGVVHGPAVVPHGEVLTGRLPRLALAKNFEPVAGEVFSDELQRRYPGHHGASSGMKNHHGIAAADFHENGDGPSGTLDVLFKVSANLHLSSSSTGLLGDKVGRTRPYCRKSSTAAAKPSGSST